MHLLVGQSLLNIIAPVGWSLIILWISNRIERLVLQQGKRKGLSAEQAAMPPLDYHI